MPPVLFIPGVLSTAQVWGPVTRRLTGIQPLVVSNPDSDSIPALARHALSELDRAGLDSAHIAGHSLGGAIALEMALTAPARVRSLTLIGTWAKTDAYSGSLMRLQALLRQRLPEDREFLHANTFIVNAAAQLQFLSMEDIAQSILLYGPLPPAAAYLNHLKAAQAHDVLDRLPAIHCPTNVIWGEEDKVFPPWHARQLMESIPGAKELRLQGVGHMAILQAADAIATLLHRQLI